ncbi:hypothetical protein C8R45DRAFT_783154, partial [Mycena sanguinolenta]
TPIPEFQVAIILLIQSLVSATEDHIASDSSHPVALVIYSFVVQLVLNTGITDGEATKTGFYAGLYRSLASHSIGDHHVFYFGRLSDFYGWRTILLLEPFNLTISML